MTITPELEAVARAIFAARYKRENDGLNTNITWDGMPATSHENYYAQARAALMAIREPTEDVLDIGADSYSDTIDMDVPYETYAKNVFKAMIDYILSETKP